MTARDWKSDPHVDGQPAAADMFECVRQRATIDPELTAAYEYLAFCVARDVRAALPNVAPELIAVVAMNFIGRIAGLGVQVSGHEGGGLAHGINIACMAALRLWEGRQ